MLLAVWSVAAAERPDHRVARVLFAPRNGTALWLVAGLAFAGLCTVNAAGSPPYVSGVFITPVLAFFLLAPAVVETPPARNWRTLPQAVLNTRALVWLGMVSYAIYLYHATLMAWLEDHNAARIFPPNHYIGLALSALIVTVVAATGSWYLVERPALRLKQHSHGRVRLLSRPAKAEAARSRA